MSSELPEVPYRVFAKGSGEREPHWWIYDHLEDEFFQFQRDTCCEQRNAPGYLKVADHPRNDPEAIAIIELARRPPDPARKDNEDGS